MKFQYIGLKTNGERAFQSETGIEWMPNSVHKVDAKTAHKLLEHPTIWKCVDSKTTLADAKPVTQELGIPAWAKEGIDAGLTDEQLAALAEMGGPETEQGAKIWLDLTGKAYGLIQPPEIEHAIRLPDGMTRILDGMTKEALHDLAKELGVKVHHLSGADKVTEALVAAFPV